MDKTMKFISWNVNGLRACMQKGFLDFFNEVDADFFCVQETKLQEGQIALDLPGYHQFWNYAEKKGYSGTAIFTKHEPLSVSYGIGIPEHDHEGRVITLEYDAFYLVTCYTPNSQNELARLPYRMQWEEDFLAFLKRLDEVKPVIVCGDLNVAHEEIDLKNPKKYYVDTSSILPDSAVLHKFKFDSRGKERALLKEGNYINAVTCGVELVGRIKVNSIVKPMFLKVTDSLSEQFKTPVDEKNRAFMGYTVLCRYDAPDGKIHIFASRGQWGEPQRDYQGENVRVYYSGKNYEPYHVDLNSIGL